MFKIKGRNAVLLFFLLYILTTLINPGFMGTDEYWTGITRYIPAQEKSLMNMMKTDDVKSPTQIMPLVGLSELALNLGFVAPYEQYRFVQIFVGFFSTILLGFCLLYFIPQEKHLFTFLSFCFYFAGSFAFTRPMYESMSAPWIVLSALSLKCYLESSKLKWLIWSVVGVSIAFFLRPQTGVCALAILGFLIYRRDLKSLAVACLVGFAFFVLAGIPDIYLREGFHSSLKGILFYNLKYGTSYAQQPWFFYLPLIFIMMWGPFWFSRNTSTLFKKFGEDHSVYWAYIILLIALHSFFPQKWERFVIPVLGLMILIMADWLAYFCEQGSKKRVWGLFFVNFILWVPASLFPAQKNIMDMSRYLDSHPEILEVLRYKKSPEWITEVFIRRKDWKWVDIEALPESNLKCDQRLVLNIQDYETLRSSSDANSDFSKLELEKIFQTNLIEKAAYKMNPQKNVRRTPLVLLRPMDCAI